MIYLENIQKFQEEPLEYQFREEIIKRLSDFAYKKQVQYNKDLKIIDIPEFAKLPEDRIESQIDVWILTLICKKTIGGHGFAPASSQTLTTKSLTPSAPADGGSIFIWLIFSDPNPFGAKVILTLSPGTIS